MAYRAGSWPFPNVSPNYGTSVVTPSVYDENFTMYEGLADLRSKIETIYKFYESFEDDANELVAEFQQKLDEAIQTLTLMIDHNYDDLKAMIIDAHPSGMSFNPTTGTETDSVSKVMSNVFDNARVFAWFAEQYDAKEMTAAEYDALELSARQYDLAPDYYPTAHDIYSATSQG